MSEDASEAGVAVDDDQGRVLEKSVGAIMDLEEVEHWKTYGGLKSSFTAEDGSPAGLIIRDNFEDEEKGLIRVKTG